MSDKPSEESTGKAVFTSSSKGLVVYSSAMITNRAVALMVLKNMYSEVLSTPESCFESVDMTYKLNRKIPTEPWPPKREVVKPLKQSFWRVILNRLLRRDDER